MTNLKRLRAGAAVCAIMLGLGGQALAQETTSSIRGEISEASRPAGGAVVTIVHLPTSQQTVVTANAGGVFDARGLRVGGPYRVTVRAADGAVRVFENVFLNLGDTFRLNVDLKVQDAAADAAVEAVVVTAGARDRNATGPKMVLNQNAVQSVVTINRDIRDLARQDILVTQDIRGTGGVSIAGANPRMTRITVDGVQAQDRFGLNSGGFTTRRGPVMLDAIEQFTVEAVPVDASNGDFQGGALNIVLRSGSNQFHGSIFDAYQNDGMVGRSIRGVPVPSRISQTNWGAFLSGPIWPGRLFFAVGYEKYKTSDLTTFGPIGAGFPNTVAGLTQSSIDQVTNDYKTLYKSPFELGSVERTEPILDEKWSAKFDANITDSQRLSFTYRHSESSTVTRYDLSATTQTLSSHWYTQDLIDDGYSLELNSKWNSRFSTQLRANYRDFLQTVLPPSGQNYADVSVCTSAASINSGGDSLTSCGTIPTVRFGPDQFRHANVLHTQQTQFEAIGNYALGDHAIKFGGRAAHSDVYNLFVSQSHGVYWFDSIADFEAGRANRLQYQNAVTGNPGDAAANFRYWQDSLFLQDAWDILPNLKLTAGLRFDFYKSDSLPPVNANFLARNGFSNTATYDGKNILMPRFAADYRPFDGFKLTVGGGLFSGGVPDVVISNSFSNTGILTSSVDIQRNADGTFRDANATPGFTNATGSAALDNLKADPNFGYQIPAAVKALQGGAVVSPLAETNALSPNFKIPAEWKGYLQAEWNVWRGWRLGAELVVSQSSNALTFRDTRAALLTVGGVAQRLPDGRIRYDAVAATAAQRAAANVTSVAPSGSNRDIVVFNSSKGGGYVVAATLSKQFDNGISLNFGYAHQDLKELGSGLRFSSTASSLYGSEPAGIDPNSDAYGKALENIQDRYKAQFAFRREFFKGLESRITLSAARFSGRPFSFTMSDVATGRGPVFGVNRSAFLLYVPDLTAPSGADPLSYGSVTFDSTNTRDQFIAAVKKFGLPNSAIVSKGFGINRDVNRMDLQFSQQLPSIVPGHPRIQVDIANVLNLIHNKWGIVEEYPDVLRVVSVQCANATGAAVAAGDFSCPRYRYSNVNTSQIAKPTIDQNGASLWTIQVSLRYEF